MKFIGCTLSIVACQLSPLVRADVDVRVIALNCLTCHMDSGSHYATAIPSLTKLSEKQIQQALMDFKYDKTPATVMPRLAKGYSDEELAALAAYFSRD